MVVFLVRSRLFTFPTTCAIPYINFPFLNIYGRIESSMDFNGIECPESDFRKKNNKNNINPEGRK